MTAGTRWFLIALASLAMTGGLEMILGSGVNCVKSGQGAEALGLRAGGLMRLRGGGLPGFHSWINQMQGHDDYFGQAKVSGYR